MKKKETEKEQIMSEAYTSGRGTTRGSTRHAQSSTPASLSEASHAASLRDEAARKQSREELPDLEARLDEVGAIFSQNRTFAIVRTGNLCTLYRRKKSGFPVEDWREVLSSSRDVLTGFSLLLLFESMKQGAPWLGEYRLPTKEDFS
jgi:hypothetical protein